MALNSSVDGLLQCRLGSRRHLRRCLCGGGDRLSSALVFLRSTDGDCRLRLRISIWLSTISDLRRRAVGTPRCITWNCLDAPVTTGMTCSYGGTGSAGFELSWFRSFYSLLMSVPVPSPLVFVSFRFCVVFSLVS
ncbi:hypothetical protein V6N12_010799 [Hibiscus sabdariffa]|uniref:Uncharacterized protein n=1 Tax=Hibiscus sabdariffa TaxID=183260 RepID=A0ABR2EMX9_9ROSI